MSLTEQRSFLAYTPQGPGVRIHVIIPAYNCAEWIGRAMHSVAIQDYWNFDVLVIDDASTDPVQPWLIRELCESLGWYSRFNQHNMRAGYNLFHATRPEAGLGQGAVPSSPEDVFFILDGDDHLPHASVLSRIAKAYDDPDAWFVYGMYSPWPHNTGQVQSRPYPDEWMADAPNGRLRVEENLANHPISFRAFLGYELTAEDMSDKRNGWFRAGYDRCMFIPMLELASEGHVRFVDEILYVYNAVNPISDSTANLEDAQAAHRHVARATPRKPLVR